MSSLQVIENKITAVKKYLKILNHYKKYSQAELEKDLFIKGSVERYLYLAVQATIDLADALIAYKKFRKPTTLREIFSILNEEKVIPDELTEKLSDMVGFRNIIAHDYEKLNYDIVYDILHQRLKDIEEFLEIANKLK